MSLSRPEDLQFRSNSAKNLEAAVKEERSSRRESLAQRRQVAIMHRAIAEEMRQKTMEEEKSLFESRSADWQAEQEHQQSLKKRARESLAFRLEEWRRHREYDEMLRMAELDREHGLAEWRLLNWREHEDYKRQLQVESKAHLATLMDHWRFAKTQPLAVRVAQAEKAIEAELIQCEALLKKSGNLLTSEIGSAFDEEESRRSLARHSLVHSLAEEGMLTQEALESHQAQLQAVHREYLACLPKDQPATPLSSAKNAEFSKGRVSLMLRLESWRLLTVEKAAENLSKTVFVLENAERDEIRTIDGEGQSADHVSEY